MRRRCVTHFEGTIVCHMDDLRLAQALADLAEEVALKYFNAEKGPGRQKADGTLVSDADLAVERALLDRIGAERPRDAVVSEEAGAIGDGRRVWTIDPIDGTASFLAGGRLWATNIALAVDGEQTIGVVSSPPLARRYWARRGTGAYRAALRGPGLGPVTRLSVSRRRDPKHSTFATSPLDAEERTLLRDTCRWSAPRLAPSVDVLDGELDAAVCVGGGPWDYAALVVLVEESGGRYSDRDGRRAIDTGCALLTNGGPVHARMLEALAAAERSIRG